MSHPRLPAHPPIAERLSLTWRIQPFTLLFAVAMIPVGCTALVYGDGVSQALSNIAVNVVARFMGALFTAGGLMTLAGILRAQAAVQVAGMVMLAAASALYGVGVVLGLGLGGIVAGTGYLVFAAGLLRRVHSILAVARTTATS